MEKQQSDAESRHVPSLVRATRILDLLVTGRPKGVSDLARELDLPKSSIHGLCQTMAALGVLARVGPKQFAIGPHVLRWANAFRTQSSLTVEFERLCAESNLLRREALNLSVFSGASVMYVACRAGSRPLGVSFSVGMSFPAVFTATGKAMMSTMSPEEIEEIVAPENWPQSITPFSVGDPEALSVELAEARERGFSLEQNQLREGMSCVGAPVFSASQGPAVAGLAVGLLSAEASPEKLAEVGRELVEFANQLSERMGGHVQGSRQPRGAT